MTPRLLQRNPQRDALRRGPMLMHPECPIEQAVHSREPAVHARLLQEIWWRRSGGGDARPVAARATEASALTDARYANEAGALDNALLIADPKSLRILARTERALEAPVNALRRRYGDALVAEPPSVRYAHGAPVLEPYMTLLLHGPEHCLAPLQKDLVRRRGRIERLDRHDSRFVLEAEAPLANLLGYDGWLGERMGSVVELGIWLSRFVPIDDDGPFAA